MDCDNLMLNNDQCSEKVYPQKLKISPILKSNESSLIKQTTDIVFNNQTDKLLKKQPADHQCKSSTPVMGKYNLRKKSVQTRSDTVTIKKPNQQTADRHLRGLKDETSKPKKKRNSQLSRYKRKNANARERNRVQEINAAFERLKKILPNDLEPKVDDKNRTKIATLRDATKHIAYLIGLLRSEPIDKNSMEVSDHCNDQSNSQLTTSSLDETEKLDHSKMDTLPEISIDSLYELSSLSYTSDKDGSLPNQSTNSNLNNLLNDLPITQNESTCIESSHQNDLNNNFLPNPRLVNCSNSCSTINNSNFCFQSTLHIEQPNSNPLNQQVLSSHQSVRIVQSNNNIDCFDNHQPIINRSLIDSNFKITNEIVLQDSNNQCSRSKGYMVNAPLINNYDHNLIDSSIHTSTYTSNKCEMDNSTINPMKNASFSCSDDLFGSFEENIENDILYSSWSTCDYSI